MSTAQPAPARDKNPGQLSPLPGVTTYLTGHDGAGQAVVQEKRSGKWRSFENDNLAFNVVYTTSFPADMNDSRDVKAHDETLASGSLGLVKKNGVICRQVEFAPGYTCMMHRTQSLDFGIVLEGSVVMVLDDGSETLMQRGDVAVQRGTKHAWKNPSQTDWCRMQFILQDAQPLFVSGERFKEDLGVGVKGLPGSGNDT